MNRSATVKQKKEIIKPKKKHSNVGKKVKRGAIVKIRANAAARIYIDNEYKGKLPLFEDPELRPGWHVVKVYNPDYHFIKDSIYISGVKPNLFNYSLVEKSPEEKLKDLNKVVNILDM